MSDVLSKAHAIFIGSWFSFSFLGKTNLSAPGNFDLLGKVAGIEFALGLNLAAGLAEREPSVISDVWSNTFLFSFDGGWVCGICVEELRIVPNVGRDGSSRISELLRIAFDGIVGGGIARDKDFCLRRETMLSSSSVLVLLLLLCFLTEACVTGRDERREELGRSSGNSCPPFRNFEAASFSVTFRESGISSPPRRLLPLLSALLRREPTRSFPSITFADGGGCNIQLVSAGPVGVVVTTGGWRSFTGGFRPT